jgi:hypothetical protein
VVFSLWCKEFPLRNQIFVLILFSALHIWLIVWLRLLRSLYLFSGSTTILRALSIDNSCKAIKIDCHRIRRECDNLKMLKECLDAKLAM